MVWDPPKQPVNVTRMIIYSFIPILSIYAGWRIQKFWVLLGLGYAIGFGIGIMAGLLYPEPYGTLVSLASNIIISVLLVRHFARKYNEKFSSEGSQPENS